MGYELKTGLDNDIQEAIDLTGSDVGFGSRVVDVLDGLRSRNNRLGTAAGANTGSSSGNVPVLDANAKLPSALLDTATTGGAASSGKIALLNNNGQFSSSMIPTVAANLGAPKYVWTFGRFDTWNRQPSQTTSTQYSYTWTPHDRSGTFQNVTTLLAIITGGGGSGSYGPAASSNRKGGGGAGGNTAIRVFTGITSGSSGAVRVGRGGAARSYNSNLASHNGNTSHFNGTDALGGAKGEATGIGGNSPTQSIDQQGLGVLINGCAGGYGIGDKWGGGIGGGTFWGTGYPAGEGQGSSNGLFAAPGAGGGGASGHNAAGAFLSSQAGTRGNDGLIVIIGF